MGRGLAESSLLLSEGATGAALDFLAKPGLVSEWSVRRGGWKDGEHPTGFGIQ